MATVMYIPEKKQSLGAMKGVMSYVCQEKKTRDPVTGQRFVTGVHCLGDNACQEFLATKRTYGKTKGMNFYQYVQSFSPKEAVTLEKAHAIALEFAQKAWPGFEVLVATHRDAGHLHSHFVVNSVSWETGRKLRQSPKTLQTLRALSDEICAAQGLSVLPRYEKPGAKLSSREYRVAQKGESWECPADGGHYPGHGAQRHPPGLPPRHGAPGLPGGLGGQPEVHHLHHSRRTKVPGHPATSRQIQKGEHGV